MGFMKDKIGGKVMFSKKKSDLTKREEEIRTYILEEYAQTVHYLDNDKNSIEYSIGREAEARRILGRILDILGG